MEKEKDLVLTKIWYSLRNRIFRSGKSPFRRTGNKISTDDILNIVTRETCCKEVEDALLGRKKRRELYSIFSQQKPTTSSSLDCICPSIRHPCSHDIQRNAIA
jgi:hypothetical protein